MSKTCPGLDHMLFQAVPHPNRLFACDCCQRTLPIWRACFPGDKRLEQAMEIAGRHAKGLANRQELRQCRKLLEAPCIAPPPQGEMAAAYILKAAGKLLSDDLTPELRDEIAQHCALALAEAALSGLHNPGAGGPIYVAALENEYQWQKKRLDHYTL